MILNNLSEFDLAVKYKIANLVLNSCTLGTRFLFIFVIAKYLEPSSVGYYGLFAATIGYALYFVGLDFYTYATREILKTPIEQQGGLLKGQAALSSVLYIILFPFALAFILQAQWPENLVWWFFPLLLLEHFNQEISRLLIALSEQITASAITFIRQGSWAIVSVIILTLHTPSRRLDVIILLWISAGVMAALLGIWKFRKMKIGGWYQSINWKWIARGIGVSSFLLLATLALRGLQTVDRYWLEALGGIEMVGAYVLLLGVAGTLMTFLDAGIFAYTYPALIRHFNHGETVAAQKKVRIMFVQTLAFSMFFSLTSWIALPYLLIWIGNEVYLESLRIYPWLLLAMIFNALSMSPHFGLYAQGNDKPLIYSHIAALIGFVFITSLLSGPFGPMAVPFGLCTSFALIFLIKSVVYCKTEKAKAHLTSITETAS